MMPPYRTHCQRGATLIVGLIMLVVITLLVTSAFTLNSSNLRSVGNAQFRDEALAAANMGIEQVLSGPFYTAPVADQIIINIDNNSATVPYVVNVAAPTCVRASAVAAATTSGSASSVGLVLLPNTDYNTLWDIDATVTDPRSGASIRVHQGIRKRLSQMQYAAVC